MTKLIKVEKCGACPYLTERKGQPFASGRRYQGPGVPACRNTGRALPYTRTAIGTSVRYAVTEYIPEWCPLEEMK